MVKGLLVHLAGRCQNFFRGRYRDPNLRHSSTTAGQSTLGQISALANQAVSQFNFLGFC